MGAVRRSAKGRRRAAWLGVGVVWLWACSEPQVPTAPFTAPDPTPRPDAGSASGGGAPDAAGAQDPLLGGHGQNTPEDPDIVKLMGLELGPANCTGLLGEYVYVVGPYGPDGMGVAHVGARGHACASSEPMWDSVIDFQGNVRDKTGCVVEPSKTTFDGRSWTVEPPPEGDRDCYPDPCSGNNVVTEIYDNSLDGDTIMFCNDGLAQFSDPKDDPGFNNLGLGEQRDLLSFGPNGTLLTQFSAHGFGVELDELQLLKPDGAAITIYPPLDSCRNSTLWQREAWFDVVRAYETGFRLLAPCDEMSLYTPLGKHRQFELWWIDLQGNAIVEHTYPPIPERIDAKEQEVPLAIDTWGTLYAIYWDPAVHQTEDLRDVFKASFGDTDWVQITFELANFTGTGREVPRVLPRRLLQGRY